MNPREGDQVRRLLAASRRCSASAATAVEEDPTDTTDSRVDRGAELLARARAEQSQPEPKPAEATRPSAPAPPGPVKIEDRADELAALVETNPGPWKVDSHGRLLARSIADVEAIAEHYGLTMEELRTINGHSAVVYSNGRQWPYAHSYFSAWVDVVPSSDPEAGGRADARWRKPT